jgi:hypothetical protein
MLLTIATGCLGRERHERSEGSGEGDRLVVRLFQGLSSRVVYFYERQTRVQGRAVTELPGTKLLHDIMGDRSVIGDILGIWDDMRPEHAHPILPREALFSTISLDAISLS